MSQETWILIADGLGAVSVICFTFVLIRLLHRSGWSQW